MTSIQVPYSIAAALPTLAVIDITNDVSREVARSAVRDGIVYVAPTADPWLVRVQEREAGFFCDVEEMLKRLVPLQTGDRQRMLLALLGPRTEAVPFAGGRLCLGTWQKILMVGFNGSPADWTCTILGR
jgi:thiamine phosphate synthase YjbQ (UPF0047 family)